LFIGVWLCYVRYVWLGGLWWWGSMGRDSLVPGHWKKVRGQEQMVSAGYQWTGAQPNLIVY
jgi:hypothetical protein